VGSVAESALASIGDGIETHELLLSPAAKDLFSNNYAALAGAGRRQKRYKDTSRPFEEGVYGVTEMLWKGFLECECRGAANR